MGDGSGRRAVDGVTHRLGAAPRGVRPTRPHSLPAHLVTRRAVVPHRFAVAVRVPDHVAVFESGRGGTADQLAGRVRPHPRALLPAGQGRHPPAQLVAGVAGVRHRVLVAVSGGGQRGVGDVCRPCTVDDVAVRRGACPRAQLGAAPHQPVAQPVPGIARVRRRRVEQVEGAADAPVEGRGEWGTDDEAAGRPRPGPVPALPAPPHTPTLQPVTPVTHVLHVRPVRVVRPDDGAAVDAARLVADDQHADRSVQGPARVVQATDPVLADHQEALVALVADVVVDGERRHLGGDGVAVVDGRRVEALHLVAAGEGGVPLAVQLARDEPRPIQLVASLAREAQHVTRTVVVLQARGTQVTDLFRLRTADL